MKPYRFSPIFMIAMSAVFLILINTISGVMNIDPNYKNAARCMGAGTWQILRDVVIPGALPSFLTGFRLTLGGAWLSVICAEFIATTAPADSSRIATAVATGDVSIRVEATGTGAPTAGVPQSEAPTFMTLRLFWNRL